MRKKMHLHLVQSMVNWLITAYFKFFHVNEKVLFGKSYLNCLFSVTEEYDSHTMTRNKL